MTRWFVCLCCIAFGLLFFPYRSPAPLVYRAGEGWTYLTGEKPDGSIVLLATNAVVHGKTIRYEPQPHKNTIGYWTKVKDWVSWDFKVTQPGKYEVTLTQSCGQGSGGSEVTFSVGEQAIKDLVPETGSFTTWTNRTIGTFTLERAGEYQITVKPVKKPGVAVMDLRAIKLTPVK